MEMEGKPARVWRLEASIMFSCDQVTPKVNNLKTVVRLRNRKRNNKGFHGRINRKYFTQNFKMKKRKD